MTEIRVYQNSKFLAEAAARIVIDTAAMAISTKGIFSMALAGGSTPRDTYRLLASEAYLPRLDWKKTTVFWSDERCVPPDHPRSNYRMAQESLLDHVPIPNDQIMRLQGELSPQAAATAYEYILRKYFMGQNNRKNQENALDLVLLGLGTDGHTASLFPSTRALDETKQWVVANEVPGQPEIRLTFTYPFINQAHNIVFLVSGSSKASVLKKVVEGAQIEKSHYPARGIQPIDGKLIWLVDADAASSL